uniref:Uncharacterized protein n=1 Tax=Ciona savignyi TaxID=51511 RepID=H2ZND7_CIOSA
METGELSEEMQDPTTSINIIYDRCGLCGNIGKALACLYCMQSDSKRFLVLTTPTKSLRSLNFQGKYMYLSRDIQDKIQNVHQVLSQHEQLIISSSNSVEELAIQASLKFKIAHCSQNVARLKKLLLARKLEMKQQQNLLLDNKRVIMTLRKKIGKVSQKKSKMKEYIRNRQDSILAIRKKEQILREDLQIHRLKHISMLVQYIFPIEECNKSDLPNMVPQVHDDHGSEVDRETALLQEEL